MPTFHSLTVTGIRKTIKDAVVVTLTSDDPAAFQFIQGQYLTFRREFDGEELRRSYSICAARHEGVLQVGIKRVDGGTFSTWANTELAIGDKLDAMPPMGNFYPPDTMRSGQHNVLFAAGSGITPILSIVRSGLVQDPASSYTLVYANRNINTIMFREELEDLKNQYLQRLSIVHILEDDSHEIELFAGRIDERKCAALFEHWIDLGSIDRVFICGPKPMMLTVSDALKKNGLDDQRIRFELFASDQPGRASRPATSINTTAEEISAKVIIGGESRSFLMSDNSTLLEAAIANKLDAPFACTAGVCSTCKARLVEGKVEMIANHALEDDEVNAGYVLTCQSLPRSDRVIWDYDQAGH